MQEVKISLDFDNVVENYARLELKWRQSLSIDDRKRYLRLLKHLKHSRQFDRLVRVAWWAIMLYEMFVFRHLFIVVALLIVLAFSSGIHVSYDETLVEWFWAHHGLVHFLIKDGKAKSGESE